MAALLNRLNAPAPKVTGAFGGGRRAKVKLRRDWRITANRRLDQIGQQRRAAEVKGRAS